MATLRYSSQEIDDLGSNKQTLKEFAVQCGLAVAGMYVDHIDHMFPSVSLVVSGRDSSFAPPAMYF